MLQALKDIVVLDQRSVGLEFLEEPELVADFCVNEGACDGEAKIRVAAAMVLELAQSAVGRTRSVQCAKEPTMRIHKVDGDGAAQEGAEALGGHLGADGDRDPLDLSQRDASVHERRGGIPCRRGRRLNNNEVLVVQSQPAAGGG